MSGRSGSGPFSGSCSSRWCGRSLRPIVSGDRAEFVGALIRSFIAFPAVAITLWATGHLLNAIDDLTWYIMNRDGAPGLFSTLQSVMWAGGQANYFFAFVIHGLLMLAMLLLMLVFAFRNIVLAALIAVGPVAWMLYPVRAVGPQWVVRYVSAVAVLLLTGPLTIGFVTLIINGLAERQDDLGSAVVAAAGRACPGCIRAVRCLRPLQLRRCGRRRLGRLARRLGRGPRAHRMPLVPHRASPAASVPCPQASSPAEPKARSG